ncbi:MAG: DUF1566 domain-containing protein [Candidatus Scalindua sp.]|jgi:hypothetical protein|nr:DUF1566 domain-containing protein [Candidatus Scalindua sp.]MBT5304142.1 DUF1566 domain-containing protein [Candidatus Scalindua sp.]MBT6048712.1 DUF1566 domain-containing protein [Candidatus Scalindua sp.]MBT6226952.1 DUF1566 domain-containing protein [Candidatus Scalindua sp.]MBT6565043.1 DUF1566 domain-containing protein [Candidatus Scalindua sp.]
MKHSLLPCILIISFVFLSTISVDSAEKKKPRINLRPYYKIVPLSEVENIPNIVIHEQKENQGFFGHSAISHDYEVNIIKDDKVVIDYATGLMWHQSGSFKNFSWKRAKKWVTVLNEKSYAGFSDWRLPTLEEAVSLLEPNEKNGNQFIDPVFDKTQSSIWTCDSNVASSSLKLDRAWSVNFIYSLISRNDIMTERKKVRPVRISSSK